MKTEPSISSSGILLLDKPVGMTSNAALGCAKRILGLKKAGHTGTLDPLASGLLVLCFGQATKVAGYLLDAEKAYEATIKLGITTDSEDAEGEVIEQREVPDLGEDDIDAVLEHFRGPIEQIPPMYSALKYHGRRLYELARRGETVARPPRPVTIHELKLLGHEGDLIELSARCSKGTYIRSLARDIGERLKCGAHLVGLRRTASEPFRVADAHTLENLQTLACDAARSLLLPADRALEHLPAVHVDEQQAARLQQGQFLSGLPGTEAGNVRIYSPELFVGIGQMDGAGHLRPTRILLTA